MTILVSGGGTGGHITPILAVAHELKKQQPDIRIVYVGERGGKFRELTADTSHIDEVRTIFAGKIRRYHNESWLRRLTDLGTIFRNIRDLAYVVIGTVQATYLLGRAKPDVIFLKGGYVGLPVGFAAALRGIPFVTHDSDAVPGLTNRLVSRWANMHATGLPTEFYSYPKTKARYVGVLVSDVFVPVTTELQKEYKTELDIPGDSRVLLITGGSLGAERLNSAVAALVPDLLKRYDDLYVVHQVGKGKLDAYANVPSHNRLRVLEFMPGMYRYTGAADVVITRAGANTLAELGVQGKACIVVPNPQLTGGHQLKNAQYLVEHNAVLVVNETELSKHSAALEKAIHRLLDYPEIRTQLGKTMQSITKPNAAHEVAELLIDLGEK